jgi:flavin reductase (DIM6/NTAB) family NADH-FMN oxidoreductase RutF
MHVNSKPSILYFGTPVVLISSKNENGTDNLAPMSSIFWLGWRCVIGLGVSSQTVKNLMRTKQCVLNIPSVNEVSQVNKLAKTTGINPVPEWKISNGYRFEEHKFEAAGFTRQISETVLPARVKECPVQMEAVVEAVHGLAEGDIDMRGRIVTFELRIQTVHIEESLLMENQINRVDPDKWKPLIMSFQQYYSLGDNVHTSTLAEISETAYNSPDRAKVIQGQMMAMSN